MECSLIYALCGFCTDSVKRKIQPLNWWTNRLSHLVRIWKIMHLCIVLKVISRELKNYRCIII